MSRTTAAVLVATAVWALGTRAMAPSSFASEANAIGMLRVIVSAQQAFASCASKGFAQHLADLAKPPRGVSHGFIPPSIPVDGTATRGYVVTLRAAERALSVVAGAQTCNGSERDAVSGFFAEAHPVAANVAHRRSFAVDERGTIYVRGDGVPIAPGMSGAIALPD